MNKLYDDYISCLPFPFFSDALHVCRGRGERRLLHLPSVPPPLHGLPLPHLPRQQNPTQIVNPKLQTLEKERKKEEDELLKKDIIFYMYKKSPAKWQAEGSKIMMAKYHELKER